MHSDGDAILRFVFSLPNCQDCPMNSDCLSNPNKGRPIQILPQEPSLGLWTIESMNHQFDLVLIVKARVDL